MDTTFLWDEECRACRAFLLTEAEMKANEPAESDSLITIAIEYYKRVQYDSLLSHTLFLRGLQHKRNGRLSNAYHDFSEANQIASSRSYKSMQDSTKRHLKILSANPDITPVIADYYKERTIKELKAKTALRKAAFWAILFTSLLFIQLIAIAWFRYRKNNQDAKHRIQEISAVTKAMHLKAMDNIAIKDSMSSLQLSSLNLFRKQWETVNRLCHDYFEWGSLKNAPGDFLKRLESEIESFSTKKNIKTLEQAVNSHMDNFMLRLRHQCPFFSESDYTFILFNVAGFSPRAICLFMNLKLKNYYMKRSRIISRISLSRADDKAFFCDRLQIDRTKNNPRTQPLKIKTS